MKIKKIYISAFGGLKDFTLEFTDNMNIVFGENENGKTTVMSFVKAMFYGTGNKAKTIEKSIRTKYTPFDGSAMGGRIYFENKSGDFILERQFLKSDSADKVTLTNVSSGESVSVPSDIGTKLFGMGADAFSNSLFLGAEPRTAPTDEAVGELNARLSSVALTGDENTSFKQIESNIEKAKEKILSKSGRVGLLIKAKEELNSLNKRLENSKNDAVRKCEINEEIEKLLADGKKLSEKYADLKKLTDAKDDIKNAEKLKEYLSLKAELDKLNETLKTPNGDIIDAQFVSKIKFLLSKLNMQKEKCNDLAREIDEMKKANEMANSMSYEETSKKLKETKAVLLGQNDKQKEIETIVSTLESELETARNNAQNEDQKKKGANKPFLVLGIICAGIGTVVGIITNPLFFISAMFGLLLIILGFVIKPNNEKETIELKGKIADIKGKIAENNNLLAEIRSKIATETANMNSLISVMNANNSVKEQREKDLLIKTERLNEETEKLSALEGETEKALAGMNIDVLALDTMEKNAETQKDLKLKLNFLSKDLGGISYEEAKKKLENQNAQAPIENIDFEQAQSQMQELGEKMTEIKQNITALETELKTSFRNAEQPEFLEREIADLLEKINTYNDFLETSNVALEVLNESFLSVRSGFGSALTDKTLDVFAKLTNGRYKTLNISKSFDISAEQSDDFGMHEIGFLSTGTIDQALLSLRLAIVKLISENEPLPVMLDDSLSNFDDNRTKTALEFLKEFSNDNQVILFTCHKSVVDSATQNNIETKNLR